MTTNVSTLSESDHPMTMKDVEALIKSKTHDRVKILHLKEQRRDSLAFLSYTIDDRNNMTIWHTEVPAPLRHMGVGAKLVEDAFQIASDDASHLRLVCPFAKGYLESHPEFHKRYDLRLR